MKRTIRIKEQYNNYPAGTVISLKRDTADDLVIKGKAEYYHKTGLRFYYVQEEHKTNISDLAFEWQLKESKFEDDLADKIGYDRDTYEGYPHDGLDYDHYDGSLEILKAPNGLQLSDDALAYIFDECGFSCVYVNHMDGSETHYSASHRTPWRRESRPKEGYESDTRTRWASFTDEELNTLGNDLLRHCSLGLKLHNEIDAEYAKRREFYKSHNLKDPAGK